MKKSQTIEKISGKTEVKENSFPVVAIGASAGGLEAMMELLYHLPPNTGMAFIYVQHLSPDHKSMLTEILSKRTKMKVQEIDDMDKIQPDNLFIIPYNKGIEVTDGHIKLIPRHEGHPAISIDILFSSLALAQKNRVIGIVLSGSASDGTIGIRDIKHQGGLTFAQDDSAKFTSMPHSAIASGAVDFILSPKEIALELERLSKHPFIKTISTKTSGETAIEDTDPDLQIILHLLHKNTGVDFEGYKMSTIKRRVLRRMLLYNITNIKEYAKLVTQKNEEIHILYQDLLINVTCFFRDSDTHNYLKETLFPALLHSKKAGETLRLWVAACATGQEAYSMAMMLQEIQETESTSIPVQIFATDLSDQAIRKARVGIYTSHELEAVSPKRIQRFFTKAEDNFQVIKSVRDMCVFAPHNILRDPPFSKLDFISCCNLFIYLDIAAQKKVVNTFHYALNNNGYLMLGKAENLSQSSDLFKSSNAKFKIFTRKATVGIQRLPELSPRFTKSISKSPLYKSREIHADKVVEKGIEYAIDNMLVTGFMPASVVINHHLDIMYLRGRTELFLTPPIGKATFNILKMARPEMVFELRNAITKAIKTKQKVRQSGIQIKINNAIKVISFEIVPDQIEWNEPLILILFNEHEQIEIFSDDAQKGNSTTAKDKKIKKLEKELAAAQAEALSTIQEQEAFTEELQSANEEVVSSNEELQTVNEELETSKEELQSANDELSTTNQELQTRNDLLHESYEYADAIVSTMHEPMLVLGKDLRVRTANSAFYQKFGVSAKETEGVLLYDLGNGQWNIPALRKLLEDIIPENSKFHNYQVKHMFSGLGEKIMSLNAMRVIQEAHREQLILLVIADITEVTNLLLEKELSEKAMLKQELGKHKIEEAKLQKAVAERTLELKKSNELLEKRNLSLVAINKELEAFNFVSSHDMQEPLRKIQSFASRILDTEKNLSEKGKDYFDRIQQSAGRMQQLIKDLLAFSHLSAKDRKFEEMNLRIIIDEVTYEFRETILEKKATIEVGGLCDVRTIHFQFRQLIHNLIGNALKFSKPGIPPHIKISSQNVKYDKIKNALLPPLKSYCHITISDNGIGFEKKYSTQIFEVFQKLHSKEEYTGTGIGLAIVKKIVDIHDGIITATSEVNKGSVFNIYIPTTEDDSCKG